MESNKILKTIKGRKRVKDKKKEQRRATNRRVTNMVDVDPAISIITALEF